MTWHTLSFDARRTRTSSISPITFTSFLSNWTTLHVDGLGCPFIFLQTDIGMTLTDAPKSTRKLCTLWLKISKVRRKGGCLFLDLPPMLASPISSSSWGWLIVGSFSFASSSALNSLSFCYGTLNISNSGTFAFIFFKSSTTSYSINCLVDWGLLALTFSSLGLGGVLNCFGS